VTRMSVITDWRTKDEELPDLVLDQDYERVIVPQKFCVLHRIIVRGRWLRLVGLRIAAVANIPFELDSTEAAEAAEAEIHHYRLKLDPATREDLKKCAPAAAAIGDHALALLPGLYIALQVRNTDAAPTKPRVALVVQEET
jgi:hypothetical protein